MHKFIFAVSGGIFCTTFSKLSTLLASETELLPDCAMDLVTRKKNNRISR